MPFIVDRSMPIPAIITKKIIIEEGGGGGDEELLKELAYYKESCKLIKNPVEEFDAIYNEGVASE